MRLMKISAMVCGLSLLLAGCGVFKKDDNNNKGGDGIVNNENYGCLQGVVMDGLNQKRVPFAKDRKRGELGVYVLVHNKLIEATPLIQNPEDENANKNLLGEYYLCGIPLDENLPVFAWFDGYQKFEGIIKIDSTFAQKTKMAEVDDHKRRYPTEFRDILIYPLGAETNDLKFTVFHNDLRVKDARVILKPTGNHMIAQAKGKRGRQIEQIRLRPLEQKTNEKGEAIFPKKELVLGGHYSYTVVPPKGGEDANLKTGELTVGVYARGSALMSKPYEIAVSLNNSVEKIKLIYNSAKTYGIHSEGTIQLVFNTEVELVPDTADQLLATLSGSVKAKLAPNLPNNKRSDTVDIKVEGHRITLTPLWAVLPQKNIDPNLAVTYRGLKIRTKNEKRSGLELQIDSGLTMKFYP